MKTKIIAYIKGLFFTYLATLIFSAVGWIEIGSPLRFKNFLIPLIVAGVIWTILFFARTIIWALLAVFASCTMGIGLIIGLGIIGYAGLKLTQFLLPEGWITFTSNEFLLFLMGGVFALIDYFVNPGDENEESETSIEITMR